jgi:hypothetical protein
MAIVCRLPFSATLSTYTKRQRTFTTGPVHLYTTEDFYFRVFTPSSRIKKPPLQGPFASKLLPIITTGPLRLYATECLHYRSYTASLCYKEPSLQGLCAFMLQRAITAGPLRIYAAHGIHYMLFIPQMPSFQSTNSAELGHHFACGD